MNKRLVGLAGKAGAGKDFVYDLLDEAYPGVVERVAFADEVRREVEDALGVTPHETAVWTKPYSDEIRALLQWWGTDYRRAQDPMYWVNRTRETIGEAFEYADLVVLTDTRFINEAALVKYLGGVTVEVHAAPEVRAERLGGHLPPEHASEDIDFPIDYFIHNLTVPHMPAALNEYLGWPDDFQFYDEETHAIR